MREQAAGKEIKHQDQSQGWPSTEAVGLPSGGSARDVLKKENAKKEEK